MGPPSLPPYGKPSPHIPSLQPKPKPKPRLKTESISILDAALRKYEEMTGNDLLDHWLVKELRHCDSADAILAIIQHQAEAFGDGDTEVMKWIDPSVHGLYTISSTLGGAIYPSTSRKVAVFAGIGVLFAVEKEVRESHGRPLMARLMASKKKKEEEKKKSHDALVAFLVDLFQRLQFILKRLGVYTLGSPEDKTLGEKIMARVISILSIVTKEMQQSRRDTYLGEELGKRIIEDALVELGNLTQEVVRMAIFRVRDSITYGKANERVQQIANVGQTEWNQIEWDVRKWFSSPDPSINYDIACATQHEGTATWFFESNIFKEWELNGSLLWIHGKPGSGKTILCSAIIKHVSSLRDTGRAFLGYFYFDFRDDEKQNNRNFVTSLLTQLAASSEPCCDIIFSLYSTHGNGAQQPSIDVLTDYLHEMLFTIATRQPIYIIVDALDECPNMSGMPSPRTAVLNLLANLVYGHDPNLHICVSSCPEIDIRTFLEPLACGVVLLHEESGQQKDICNYVSDFVHSDKNTRRWRDSDKKLVVEELSKKADGRFRWVFCQLEALQNCDQPSIPQALRQLPETLDETYARILSRISPENRTHICRILQCLMVAVRPLRVEELAEVLAFEFDTSQGAVPSYRPRLRSSNQEWVALSAYSSLVAIVEDHGSQIVQFSHSSVQEFLKSDLFISSLRNLSGYQILPGAAHTILAQACLGFFLYLDDRMDDESVNHLPLVKYAAEHWLMHAQAEDVASRLKDVMTYLFGPDGPPFATWVGMYDYNVDEPYQSDLEPFSKVSTSLSSTPNVVERLAIKHPQHINTVGSQYEFSLLGALRRKHFLVVEILLQFCVDANIRGIRERTPLHNIIGDSDADAIQLLLKYGADVNAQQDDLSTPLHLAARHGNLTGARLLLTHGAKVNARNLEGMTPLCLLTEHDHIGLTQLLLQHGADVNSRTKNQWTPLHWSALRGRLEIARALLDRGANANAENDQGETPLHLVSQGHHDSQEYGCSISKLLLEHGADPHARNKDYTTPWMLARFRGRFDIARVLLYHDAKTPTENDEDPVSL